MFDKILHKEFKRKVSKNKNKQFLSVTFADLLSKERDCIILLFDVKHFEDTYLRLLSIIVDSGEFFFLIRWVVVSPVNTLT